MCALCAYAYNAYISSTLSSGENKHRAKNPNSGSVWAIPYFRYWLFKHGGIKKYMAKWNVRVCPETQRKIDVLCAILCLTRGEMIEELADKYITDKELDRIVRKTTNRRRL